MIKKRRSDIVKKQKKVVLWQCLTVFCVFLIVGIVRMEVKVSAKTTIKMAQKKITMYEGQTKTCKVSVKPKKTKVTFQSKNSWVASVSSKGKITAGYAGTTKITAKAGKKKAVCKLTVKPKFITMNTASESMFVGESITLKAKAAPSAKITWESENPDIASVSKKGVVKARRPGAVRITAAANGITSSCYVQVSYNHYRFPYSDVTVFVGETKTVGMEDISEYVNFTYPTVSVENQWGWIDEENPYMSVESDNNEAYVTGKAAGITMLDGQVTYYRTKNGKYLGTTVKDSCKIHVVEEGIDQQHLLYGKGKQGIVLHYKKVTPQGIKVDTSSAKVEWYSSNSGCVSVGRDTGELIFRAPGKAIITAKVIREDGNIQSFTTDVTCTQPVLKVSRSIVSVGESVSVVLNGTKSDALFSVSSSQRASLESGSSYNGLLYVHKKGAVTVYAQVDGVTVASSVIQISNPVLKSSDSIILTKGKKSSIKWKGTVKNSKISYKVSGKAIKISKKGVITGKKLGNAAITATVDGKEFTILACVGNAKAVKAVKTAQKIIKNSTYDRFRRMQEGFYDCSALVWKGYRFQPGLIGGSSSYAPVAADQAKYMADHGKVLSYGPCDTDKMLPGDLIFYGSKAGIEAYNGTKGRYLNIYHVSMYAGNGLRVENPVQYYYPQDTEVVMVARPIG